MHTIEAIIAQCQHHINACHQAKAIEIDQALLSGTPFMLLGGKWVRSRKGLLRFKLGSEWRLLYQMTKSGLMPCALVNRQCFERELKRRRSMKTVNRQTLEYSL